MSIDKYFAEHGEARRQRDEAAEAKRPKVSSDSFSFKFSGRDASRYVLDYFRDLAKVLRDADGTLECSLVWEDDRETRETYTIREGELREQNGSVA